MAKDMEQLYQERLKRYVTAMRNEKPDMIPIRPFVAEFTAKYAGSRARKWHMTTTRRSRPPSRRPKTSSGTRWSRTWFMSGRA